VLSQDDAEWFATYRTRNLRLKEIGSLGHHRRQMEIIARNGRSCTFVVGPTFCPLDRDSELTSFIGSLTRNRF
jgi:hypothetical protein